MKMSELGTINRTYNTSSFKNALRAALKDANGISDYSYPADRIIGAFSKNKGNFLISEDRSILNCNKYDNVVHYECSFPKNKRIRFLLKKRKDNITVLTVFCCQTKQIMSATLIARKLAKEIRQSDTARADNYLLSMRELCNDQIYTISSISEKYQFTCLPEDLERMIVRFINKQRIKDIKYE